MRTYTLALSIAVHLIAVAAIFVAPLVATGTLPEPRRAFEFVSITPLLPPSPPPPRRRGPSQDTPKVSPHAAPVDAPDRIAPEPGIERFDGSRFGDESGVVGIVPGSDVEGLLIGEPPPPPAPAAPRTPVRVGGLIVRPQKIREVAPVYPAIAQAAGVQGIVVLEAVIGEDGRVRNLRVLRSIALLDQAAVDAVRQWQFTPTRLNGEPVPVVMTVTVAFTLR
jgi:protein TonB